MKVFLLGYLPLENVAVAGLTCTDYLYKMITYMRQPKPFINRLLKAGHESVIEHIVYTFRIEGITRGLLQQLARHRLLSLSVQSTRWSLNRVLSKRELQYVFYVPPELEGTDRDAYIDAVSEQLYLASKFASAYGNDVAKYLIPECMYTDLVMTVNARELRHIFKLRAKPPALKEFNVLMQHIYDALPDDHKFMYAEFLGKEVDSE